MRDRRFQSDDEGAEVEEASWQDSYSDLMTDLLAIFVVLFSFAMMSQAFKADSAKKASVGQVIITSNSTSDNNILDGNDGLLPVEGKLPEEDKLLETIDSYIEESSISNEVNVTKQGDNTIVLRVAGSILFESGKAEITKNADPLLAKISEILTSFKDQIKMIRIEGHTDNVPTSKKYFETNWELSSSRAVTVLKRILELSELDPEKISAVGYAEFQPIADNDTVEGKAKNRRVDFIIETVDEE